MLILVMTEEVVRADTVTDITRYAPAAQLILGVGIITTVSAEAVMSVRTRVCK